MDDLIDQPSPEVNMSSSHETNGLPFAVDSTGSNDKKTIENGIATDTIQMLPSYVTDIVLTPSKPIQSIPMDSVSSKSTITNKRKSSGGLKVKASSISPKVPAFLAKNSKGSVSYFTLVHEAIVELNDRTGSSFPAIMKFLKSRHPELEELNPNSLQNSVNGAIKTGLKEGKLLRVKASFKINKDWLNKEKNAFKSRENKKKAEEKKKQLATAEKKKEANIKKEADKKKETSEDDDNKLLDLSITDEEREALVQQMKDREKKIENAEKAKEIEERIKKRKFPMDDLELVSEDKELGVKKPANVTRQPFLPFILSTLIPHDARPKSRKSCPSSIISNCSTDVTVTGSRGLFSDVLQVYHFFVGDLGYARMHEGIAPQFTLKQLLFAVNEIVLGNSKKSKVVPPLISHLFVAALSILTHPSAEDWVSEDDSDHSIYDTLKGDLSRLSSTLTDASWGETLIWYIDAMDRFHKSDSTKDKNAFPGYPIDMVGITGAEDAGSQEDLELDLPTGFDGYLGSADCISNKAHKNLLRRDPWHLSAEELFALLRILTDDILCMKPQLSKDMVERDDKLFHLLKKKKAAESNYRKVAFAYNGPKNPKFVIKKTADGKEEKIKEEFIPTATKAEYEAATKAMDRAVDNYEKAMKYMVARTTPVGYDKNHNSVYFFHNDPDSFYIEMYKGQYEDFRGTKSWHCIDTKSLFDAFVSSLDVRGIREANLFNELTGDNRATYFKRHLIDEVKKESLISAYMRQEEELEKRLNVAIVASSESSRRSGRLADNNKNEVTRIEEEMAEAKAIFEEKLRALDAADDYFKLSGVDLLIEFEKFHHLAYRCSDLWNENDNIPGIVGKVVNTLLELEALCDELSPWERNDISRPAWRKKISDIYESWQRGSTLVMGPKKDLEMDAVVSPSKRQRMQEAVAHERQAVAGQISFDLVISVLRDPLLDLENRIYDIVGLNRAIGELDLANDNMTVDSGVDGEDADILAMREERGQLAWKKKIYSLNSVTPRQSGVIREVIISAIAIARKAGLSHEVINDLRASLSLHRPGAGGRARTAALALLEKYPYTPISSKEDEEELSETEDESVTDTESQVADDGKKEDTFLAAEAMMLSGSLEGDQFADRVDWKDAVATCQTISRFAALLASLFSRSIPKLQKIQKDAKTMLKAISYWEANSKTRNWKTAGRKVNQSSAKFNSTTELWTDVRPTDTFVMGKVEGFPWWAARVCVPKNKEIYDSLTSVNKTVISFVGEQQLYVVDKDKGLRPFDTVIDKEDALNFPPEVMKNVEKSITLANRILRGKGIVLGKEELNGMVIIEEKKLSS